MIPLDSANPEFIYEIVITTLRNRSGRYLDQGFCINQEPVAREIEQTIRNKLLSCRSKDVYNYLCRRYQIISMLEIAIRQKEAQLGIYNDTTGSNYTSSTKESA